MPQLQCLRVRLAPESTDRVAAFLRGLRHREAEVRRSLRAEGILDESLFLDRSESGDFLVFFTRARDLTVASAAFRASELPLDLEAKRMISETWTEVSPLELLVDLPGDLDSR